MFMTQKHIPFPKNKKNVAVVKTFSRIQCPPGGSSSSLCHAQTLQYLYLDAINLCSIYVGRCGNAHGYAFTKYRKCNFVKLFLS